MKLHEVELPSNRKFGTFFTVVFGIAGLYFLWKGTDALSLVLLLLAGITFLVTLINSELLLPFNKAWMWLGLILGMIVSPIVLGLMFFGIFTPIAVVMRIFGRDELRLKRNDRNSHWKTREPAGPSPGSFKNQF